MTQEVQTSIQITCKDDYPLSGVLYRPRGPIKAAVMIGPATGIKKTFYNSFATHLAEQGYGVLTFENRGIGESLHARLKDSNATLRDWGYLDMPAALETLNIAIDANVDDMTRVFTKMTAQGKIERKRIDPQTHGYPDIGHMKFFSRKRSKLWTLATDWLERHS